MSRQGHAAWSRPPSTVSAGNATSRKQKPDPGTPITAQKIGGRRRANKKCVQKPDVKAGQKSGGRRRSNKSRKRKKKADPHTVYLKEQETTAKTLLEQMEEHLKFVKSQTEPQNQEEV